MNDDQNQFANDLSAPVYGQQPPKPQKNWFGRNWFWFVPVIILLPIFCCCGGGGALIWFGIGQALEMPPYKDSIALAEQNTEVQNQLGTPIDSPEGFMDLVTMMQEGGEFNFNQTNSFMMFDAKVPLHGPNGTGMLTIEAESPDGGLTWTYTLQEIELPDGTVVDLLPGDSSETSSGDPADLEAVEESPTE